MCSHPKLWGDILGILIDLSKIQSEVKLIRGSVSEDVCSLLKYGYTMSEIIGMCFVEPSDLFRFRRNETDYKE